MLQLSEQINFHLRACANCGRGIILRTSPINLYCHQCWENLFLGAKFSRSFDYPFVAYSLFVWNEVNPQIENLIYSLKAGGLPQAFDLIAERFAFEHSADLKHSANRVLVVPPSNRPREQDHAWSWGESLSRLLGCELLAPFEFATENEPKEGWVKFLIPQALKPQKQRSLKERFERQFNLKAGTKLKGMSLVFVDDLITSGATAAAAHRALNSPVDFEVWTIARRPKLAAKSSI